MNQRLVSIGLRCVGVLGVAAVVRVMGWPLARVVIPEASGAPAPRAASPQRVATESLGTRLVGRDPFRIARRPASVAYDPLRVGQPETPPVPKPVLSLVGVVTGRAPSALIEGFPGIEGVRLVREGDLVAGLRVKRITEQGVRIAGMDTVWVLTMRKLWN